VDVAAFGKHERSCVRASQKLLALDEFSLGSEIGYQLGLYSWLLPTRGGRIPSKSDVLSSRSNIADLLQPNSSEKFTQLLGKKFGTLNMG
jgi:hypothetical protein